MNIKLLFSAITLVFFALSSSPLHAADGDYNFWQFLKNLAKAPSANNPVDNQLIDDLKLSNGQDFIQFSANPSGHNDGFSSKKYGVWQVVTMDGAATGAQCADGSDYKFLVNRSARSRNLVMFFEGGGGCWSYETCSISAGGFTNSGLAGGKEGTDIPDLILRLTAQSSLATTSLRPLYNPAFRNWTKVYMPYCTQDLLLSDSEKVYEEINGDGVEVLQQKGLRVQGAVINWLKSNLEKPAQLLMTGQSAGGFGSELMYHVYRKSLEPNKGYLLNDSGPLFPAPQGSSLTQFPSQPVHQRLQDAWNPDKYLTFLEEESQSLPGYYRFTRSNIGSMSKFLSESWPQDRFTLVSMRKDNTISGFSYNTFYEDIFNESDLDARDFQRDQRRLTDAANKRSQLNTLNNYGYFIPGYRPALSGHVITIPLIESSTVNESDGRNVLDAIANLTRDNGRVMESWESDYGLFLDKNGRYNDCINYAFSALELDKEGGDVYLNTESGNQLQNIGQILVDLLTGQSCLGNFQGLSLSGLTGIDPIWELAPRSDRF